MTAPDNILTVPAPRKERPEGQLLTPRQAVGMVVEHLIGARGLRNVDVGHATRNLSEPTLYRIIAGTHEVRDQKLWTLAGILDVPTQLFNLILAGDRTRIDALVNLSDSDKQFINDVLDRTDMPTNRRNDDR